MDQKIRAFDELKTNFDENQKLLKNKFQEINEMNEQKQDLESKFEEAKVKNQTMAQQMENLIKVIEIESKEKDILKESLQKYEMILKLIMKLIIIFWFSLQKENFEESDLIRDKDNRIVGLQNEIRKQVEDMQEVEELLNEKQNEIQVLNNNIVSINKEKTELFNKNEELTKKLESIQSDANEEVTALQRQIEDLNEENDCYKSEIKSLRRDFDQELSVANEKLRISEEESLSTIEELRKQLESQEIKLTEAMNELMTKSDENTDTNLLNNENQSLRQTLDSLQQQNQLLENEFQKSVSQLNASVVEYKVSNDFMIF